MTVNIQALKDAPVYLDPYPHLVVPNFLTREQVAEIVADYPQLDMADLFLPEAAPYGPAFERLLDDMQGPEIRAIVGEKLGVDLEGRPALATVRSCCQAKDGRIHPDAKFKLATMLLYLNEPWAPQGGRLRILRSGTNIEDYAAEVSPEGGTLVVFKVQPDSWHGHKPFVGPRRYLMINYCEDQELLESEAARHRLSGHVKKFQRLFGIGKIPTPVQ
jgi:hypothetical protein